MSQLLRERIKNFIIFILIVAGIVQVGILYGYQSQGSPTDLFLGLFRFFVPERQISDEVARNDLFVPDRLILSDGEKSYWVVGKGRDIYAALLDEVQKDLRSIASEDTSIKKSEENWGDITEKKGILVDFGYAIKPKLLAWFLGIGETAGDMPEIVKLMIKPDIVDPKSGIVYLYSSDEKVVYVSDPIQFGRAVDLEKMFETVSQNRSYRLYNTFRSANIDASLKAPPDILYVNSNPKYWAYGDYSCRIPARLQNREELANILLGNDKVRYNVSDNTSGTLQYSDNSNVYKLYSDGCLTYQYLGTVNSSGKGSIGDAILNAYKFIDNVSQLLESDADMIMTDISEESSGIYKISFDYRVDNMPVRLATGLQSGNMGKLEHAITIQTDSRRMLKCVWLLREFTQSGKVEYNDRFIDLTNRIGRGFDEIKIKDIHTGYYIRSTEESILKPYMLIDLIDNPTIPVEMPAAE